MGRPLLLGGDPAASLLAAGVPLSGPASLGRLVREAPEIVSEHYQREIASGVDVLAALTGESIPRSLARIGMPFRSAALTGTAVELALDATDAAPRPLAVAGVLGSGDVSPMAADRMAEELGMHAVRLATAGCELLLARGFGGSSGANEPGLSRLARRAAVVSASATQLPTWAVVALDDTGHAEGGESAEDCARAAIDAGAQVVIFEVPGVAAAAAWLERLKDAAGDTKLGMLPASAPGSDPEAWAEGAKALVDAGVRVIGGGPGTSHRHIASLSSLLKGGAARYSLWPGAVS